jgi:hypothetical protein
MANDKVVYLHRKKTDNSIFYVGMGSLKRAYCKQRSEWWNRIVSKHGYTVEIYKDGLTKEEAFELEIELISKYGRIDLKNGQLINQTKGGLAVQGISCSILKRKIKSLKSVVKTEEWKNKISLAHKGKIMSKEHRESISKGRKGMKIPEHVKAKMRLSNKSKIITAIPISCYDYYTDEFIANFSSLTEASKELGCLDSAISNNLRGRSKKTNSKILNRKLKFKHNGTTTNREIHNY